jgi:hypothetical protein
MWKNPHPDKKVISVDCLSKLTSAAPFCVAMTIEEDADISGSEDAMDSPPH